VVPQTGAPEAAEVALSEAAEVALSEAASVVDSSDEHAERISAAETKSGAINFICRIAFLSIVM
jgi:hypothetical protein